jgi:hypothetical protein
MDNLFYQFPNVFIGKSGSVSCGQVEADCESVYLTLYTLFFGYPTMSKQKATHGRPLTHQLITAQAKLNASPKQTGNELASAQRNYFAQG